MTVGASVINIAGTLQATTPMRDTEIGVSQTVDEIEVKAPSYIVPHGGATISIPLGLSTGINEALVLHMKSDGLLTLILTSSDVTAPGPMRIQIMGHQLLTMAPGGGIISISAINLDNNNDVNLELIIGALAVSTDEPTYWFPPSP